MASAFSFGSMPPAAPVIVVGETVIVAGPWIPCGPVGIKKSNTAFVVLPEFVTTADVPGLPVVVVPTVIVAAVPGIPGMPGGPG